MGQRQMRGDELERYAKNFRDSKIDLSDQQARKLAGDMIRENALLKQSVKAAEKALDAVVRGK